MSERDHSKIFAAELVLASAGDKAQKDYKEALTEYTRDAEYSPDPFVSFTNSSTDVQFYLSVTFFAIMAVMIRLAAMKIIRLQRAVPVNG